MKKVFSIALILIFGFIVMGPVSAVVVVFAVEPVVYYSHHGLPDDQPEPATFQKAINHDMLDHVGINQQNPPMPILEAVQILGGG
jgi:hypothetical protein